MEIFKGNQLQIGFTFRSLDQIILGGSCKLRRIFSLKFPFLQSINDQYHPDFPNSNLIPKNLCLPHTIDQINQVISFQTIQNFCNNNDIQKEIQSQLSSPQKNIQKNHEQNQLKNSPTIEQGKKQFNQDKQSPQIEKVNKIQNQNNMIKQKDNTSKRPSSTLQQQQDSDPKQSKKSYQNQIKYQKQDQKEIKEKQEKKLIQKETVIDKKQEFKIQSKQDKNYTNEITDFKQRQNQLKNDQNQNNKSNKLKEKNILQEDKNSLNNKVEQSYQKDSSNPQQSQKEQKQINQNSKQNSYKQKIQQKQTNPWLNKNSKNSLNSSKDQFNIFQINSLQNLNKDDNQSKFQDQQQPEKLKQDIFVKPTLNNDQLQNSQSLEFKFKSNIFQTNQSQRQEQMIKHVQNQELNQNNIKNSSEFQVQNISQIDQSSQKDCSLNNSQIKINNNFFQKKRSSQDQFYDDDSLEQKSQKNTFQKNSSYELSLEKSNQKQIFDIQNDLEQYKIELKETFTQSKQNINFMNSQEFQELSDNSFQDYQDKKQDQNEILQNFPQLKIQQSRLNANDQQQEMIQQKKSLISKQDFDLRDSLVELVFDPVLNCYYDPSTNQYYDIMNE